MIGRKKHSHSGLKYVPAIESWGVSH